MTDTYARVMMSADEPGKRRAVRSQAPRRPDAAGETEASPVAAVDVAGTPAAKPKRSRSSAPKPKPAAVVTVPSDRTPAQGRSAQTRQAQDAGSPAEGVFAAASAAFMAGRDALASRGLQFEDVPAPKRLAPFA